jgi:sugar O-acyltransferase (sialic acid O-acetyltransferase NeuD family)
MKKIAIYGAGGFGREVKMLIDQINQKEKSFDFIGYFDDGVEKGKIINHYPVLGGLNELNNFSENLNLVFSLASPSIKEDLLSKITKRNLFFPVLIHPSCHIGTDQVQIGEGSIICAGSIITVNIEIGKHVFLNLSCTIGHDTVIEDYCSFMPSVNISGEVKIGKGVYCGTGAKIINQLEIGENSTIGSGAVVVKNVPNGVTVVGVPARILNK